MPSCPSCGCPAQPCIDPSAPITRTIDGSGCILIGFDFVDGGSIDFSINGASQFTGEVIASPDPGNQVDVRANGVFVPLPEVELCADGACDCGNPMCTNRLQLCSPNTLAAPSIEAIYGEILISKVDGVVLDENNKQFIQGPRQAFLQNPSSCLDMVVHMTVNSSAPDIDVSANAHVISQTGFTVDGVGGYLAEVRWDPCSNLSPTSGAAGASKCAGSEAYPSSSTTFVIAAGATATVILIRYFNVADDEPGTGPVAPGEGANINTTGACAARFTGYNVDAHTQILDQIGGVIPAPIQPPAAP